ncbi:MAG: nitroreductase family deazaflavin-dependent oxidoreductase [Caldilineaceae bacterium]|nr:nitroreductase family deazaflavin-dependent oxidoreductase [Caldilineaceae bacterium]
MTEKRSLAWWQKPLFAFAGSKAGGWYFLTIAPRIDPLLLRLSRGRWSSGLGQPVGILKIRGAKSGLIRETTLLCTPDGENFIVVASRAGNLKHPAWYYNLRANPEIRLLIHGQESGYIARETSGAERDELWRKAVWFYPGYAAYKERAGARVIPVFLLRPNRDDKVTG